jgi:hypothetical protein
MTFLEDRSLSENIKAISSEPGAKCAVAFWGKGAADSLSTGARIICNLTMGGTNPSVIRKLWRRSKNSVRHNPRLHAKVYIGSSQAVVCSANMSANGLRFEGAEVTGWIEAGALLSDVTQVAKWFEELWNSSSSITDADLKAAEEQWRKRSKPTLESFGSFDPESDRIPIVTWVGSGDWEPNKTEIERQAGR